MATIAIEDIKAEASQLLASLGEGSMSPCAYDTAWVARLTRPDAPNEPLFPESFDWLLRNQHEDGSWGAEIDFAHDRVISTLSALVALASSQYRQDEAQRAVRRGVVYLNRERPNLQDNPAETVGFELILPELVRQAKALKLRLPYKDWEFVEAIKADKLRRIPPIAIYGGPTPMTHSLEFLGDRLAPMLVQRCQSPNGSYGASPSATAYVETRFADSEHLRYLRRVVNSAEDGGLPFLYPFETFETGWVLYFLAPLLEHLPAAVLQPHVERLANAWDPTGTGWTSEYPVTDSDDTAIVLYVLNLQKKGLSHDVFRLFECDEYFYCFAFERNDSVGANAHILQTLMQYAPNAERRRMAIKILNHLKNSRIAGEYWIDKWHVSPLYGTEEVITSLGPLASDLIRPSVNWILEGQHEDGSWGIEGGNIEETALAVLALTAASRHDGPVRRLTDSAAERGIDYIIEHRDGPKPSLWLGKGVYRPHNIVQAMVLSSLYGWVSRRNQP
jgi:halimadienyl-diphosphate synthase